MTRSAQKTIPTTQRFTEISDIVDNVVILSGGQACLIIEVKAVNFSLQSQEDQQIKILTYASLLNSLSFPIQIVVVSRKIDISNYIGLLEDEQRKTPSDILAQRIRMYKEFVRDLVRTNTVLDKKFYIAISFSFLEKGASAVGSIKDKNAFAKDAKNLLMSKATSVLGGLQRIGLVSKVLGQNELINLYYEIYNSEGHNAAEAMGPDINIKNQK